MNNSGTKTGLFLIELVVALLLFAFCAAICMQLFVAARQRTRDSDSLSQGVYIATTAAEMYKFSGGSLTDVGAFTGGDISGDTLTVRYLTDWSVTAGDWKYKMTVKSSGGLAEITVTELRNDGSERQIYELSVKAVKGVA